MIVALSIAAGIALAVSQYFIWVYAPIELTMGLVQKIFYFHLPMAWWGLISFFVTFVASVAYLVRRKPAMDRLAGASAEVGLLFATFALVTGSVWGRAAWNVWWTWDPRLTTTLVMWFVYAGYLVLRTSPIGPERRRLVCAALGVVAFLDVPLVFFSARLWRSIHPAVFASQGGGLEPEMWHAVIASLVGWGLLWPCLVAVRYRLLAGEEKLAAARLGAMD